MVTDRAETRDMSPGRLEAFTDGVVAIIITIMVLDLKVPAGHDLAAMTGALPVFLAYVLRGGSGNLDGSDKWSFCLMAA